LIFPLFLFLVGLLIPLFVSRYKNKGISNTSLHLHIVKRMLLLAFLGLVNYGLLRFDWPAMRWSSVLGRIGVCYWIASLFVIHTNWRVQLATVMVLLVGYWAALIFIPVPGFGAGVLTPEGCLTTWLDQQLIPGTLGLGSYDRQGVLSTVTCVASTLIGVLAGHWLFSDRTQKQKALGLVLAGLGLLGAGWMWGRSLLISRNIWTSSFVLYSSGWCLLLLTLFYWVIDVKGYKKWTFFLVVIGMNSITIWVGQRLIDFQFTTDVLFLGFSKQLGAFHPVFLAFCLVFVKWFFLWVLYRHKLFLKA
jgi:predicted acyltransferase